jgi:hypothetical protein
MIRSEAAAIIVRRLNLNAGRVAALAQRVAEAGLLPKANGRDVPDLGALELASLFLAAVADNGLGNAPTTVRSFEALESEGGLLFADFLESLIAGRVNPAGILSLAVQIEPEPAVSVITGATRLQFGDPAANAAKGVVIGGDALRNVIEDFKNGVG